MFPTVFSQILHCFSPSSPPITLLIAEKTASANYIFPTVFFANYIPSHLHFHRLHCFSTSSVPITLLPPSSAPIISLPLFSPPITYLLIYSFFFFNHGDTTANSTVSLPIRHLYGKVTYMQFLLLQHDCVLCYVYLWFVRCWQSQPMTHRPTVLYFRSYYNSRLFLLEILHSNFDIIYIWFNLESFLANRILFITVINI